MPPIAKLLSIFTKKIKSKGSLILLSISANQTSPAIKSIMQSRDLSPVYHTSSSWALENILIIDVGGGPSGPSIEGPFCRAVYLCRALGDRKIEKK